MIRLTALFLTLLTGFAGLVYEVVWQKYLATLLGSHAEATAAVLAIFLGGLALGYALFGRLTRRVTQLARSEARPAHLLRFYAVVEAGIGIHALAFPTLFGIAQRVSILGPSGEGVGFAYDVALSALLIGPPTVLMGATIPMLTLALAGTLEHATRVHAWVYGVNTLGAFAGALVGGFYLVPALGLDGVVYALATLNLGAAAIFGWLDAGASRVAPDLAEHALPGPVARFGAWASVALLAGFAMMTLQTIFNRLGALALGSSNFTFAMVVAVFVLCIAIGSLAVSTLPRIPRGAIVASQWTLVLLLFPLYLFLGDVTYWAHTIRALFQHVAPAFYAYHLTVFATLLAVLIVPIGASGALLPLIFHRLRREVRDLGAVAGRLYAWNTVGSLLGALLGGYVLLFWLDLHHAYRVAMAAVAIGASLLIRLELPSLPRFAPALVLLPTLGAIWLLPAWSPERLTAGTFRVRTATPFSFLGPEDFYARQGNAKMIFYDDDPTNTVSVTERQDDPKNRAIAVNGKSDGHLTQDYATMALSALIPALMAERHERAFVIGWGLGVTAGELAALDDTRSVRVAEISRGVIEAAPLFSVGNLAAVENPKVDLQRGDAYRTLLESEDQFDVIVSEPSNPWVAGVEMLYSREFLEVARNHLRPGGVYAQWIHLYESDMGVASLVLRTYAAVFPEASVWFTIGPDLLLLGFNGTDRALDVAALEERFHRPDFEAGFGRVGIETFPQLVSHELLPLGTLHATDFTGPIHTLRHPLLSDAAARAFYVGSAAAIPPFLTPAHTRVASRNSLLRRYGFRDGRLSEGAFEAATRETCRMARITECATLFARWGFDYPGSPRMEQALIAARAQTGGSPLLAPLNLAQLWVLHSGQVDAPAAGQALQRAQALTNRFQANYLHAVPFDRNVIEEIWSRCHESGCEESRRHALAHFDAPPTDAHRLDSMESGEIEDHRRARGAVLEPPTVPAEPAFDDRSRARPLD